MKEYTVSVPGGIDLTLLLDEDEAKARGAKPVQAAAPAAEPAADTEPQPDALPVKTVAPANKARAGQAKA